MNENTPSIQSLLSLAISGQTEPVSPCALDAYITPPPQFKQYEDGLYMLDGDKEEQISINTLVVVAQVRDAESGRWGRLGSWIDCDHKLHSTIIFDDQINESRKLKELVSLGFQLLPGQNKNLATLLMTWNVSERVNIVGDMGWIKDSLTYVTPFEVIRSEMELGQELIAYAAEAGGRVNEMCFKSTLALWRQQVPEQCHGNPLQIFILSMAFASPLLYFVGHSCGAVNLYGMSSKGKTTLLQIFASVFGNGADPDSGADSSIRRWDATANGLEGMASKHNDIGMCLDESGSRDSRDIRYVIYNLLSGQPKATMNSARQLQQKRSWRCLIASTGEKSFKSILEENGGQAMAGQLVRIADVPIDNIESTCKAPAKQAQQLKQACGEHYGTAGPEFIRELTNLVDDDDNLLGFIGIQQLLREELEDFNTILHVDGLLPEQARVLNRFSLIALAGFLASEFEILPFTKEEIVDAVKTVRDQWLAGMQDNDPGLQGLINVARFIAQQTDQCIEYTEPRTKKQLVLIPGEQFSAACGDVHQKEVIQKLSEQGYLHRQESKRAKSTFTVNGKRARFYALKPSLRNHYINN